MIEMIAGTFGLPVGGSVKAMTNKSGPFEASAEHEARLVGMGLAKYVEQPCKDPDTTPDGEPEDEHEADTTPIGFDDVPPDVDELSDGVEEVNLADLSAKELRECGKQFGLNFKANTTKADMIAAIEAAMSEADAEDDDEPGPDFDPAEAVL